MILAESANTLSRLLQVIELGVTTGSIYALIALGYTLVYGIIDLINFAHGDVFMWGTVIYAFALGWFHIDSAIPDPITLVFSLLGLMGICMLGCALLSLLLERIAYRPLRRAPRQARMVSAIGASFILENIALLLIGPAPIPVVSLFSNDSWMLLGVRVRYLDAFTIFLSLALMAGLAVLIARTRLGRAMRSVAQDREAASLMGVNVNQMIVITFVLGGALAGAAGMIYAMTILNTYYIVGFKIGLSAFTAAIVGGIGNIYGAMIGGIGIGLLEAFVISYLSQGAEWAEAIIFGMLALVMILRPTGFLGRAVSEQA